jgi:pilus assembly protein CpaE
VAATLTVNLVGSRDRQLEELLHTCGLRVSPIRIEEIAALAHPAAPQPALVMIDMRDKPAWPASVAALRRQHPGTGVVIVAGALDPTLMLDAMRAGVTEFLTVPLSIPELQVAISRVTNPVAPASNGEVIAFLGAKGGVGTTTVAVNVATALAQAVGGTTTTPSTLLIDLHVTYGDAAVFLGAEPRFSVLDALENVHRLDNAFLSGIVGHAAGGLSLLASSDRSAGTPVDAPSVRALVEAAARYYRYVILDVPRSEVMMEALEPASRIIIVANQELATVRAATRLSTTLRQRYGKDRLMVVVSRYDHQAEIGQDDVEKVLGSPVTYTFPSNYRIALEALNTGRPVVLDNHNKLAAALTSFARGLVDTAEEAPVARRPSGLFSRLTGRGA